MAHFARLVRVCAAAVLTVVVASACGGQSFSNGRDDGNAGNGGEPSQGGSGTGGKNAAGSSSSKAGTTSGGVGTGGTGVGGSSGGDECTAPPVSGNCTAYFEAWYHDPATGICRPFAYGGCGGNANRYDSLAACQKSCGGVSPRYDSCKEPSDCVVTGQGCCGVCDSPSVTAHDLIAYNRKYAGELAQCDVACAPCAAPEPGLGTLANFVPGCVNNRCTVVDIRQSELTACKAQTDCAVRHGNGCCEGCAGDYDLISVRNDGSFESYVCGSQITGCPDCAALPPSNVTAECGPEGHCSLSVVLINK